MNNVPCCIDISVEVLITIVTIKELTTLCFDSGSIYCNPYSTLTTLVTGLACVPRIYCPDTIFWVSKRLPYISHSFDYLPPEIHPQKPREVFHSCARLKTAQVFKEYLVHPMLFTEPDCLGAHLTSKIVVLPEFEDAQQVDDLVLIIVILEIAEFIKTDLFIPNWWS